MLVSPKAGKGASTSSKTIEMQASPPINKQTAGRWGSFFLFCFVIQVFKYFLSYTRSIFSLSFLQILLLPTSMIKHFMTHKVSENRNLADLRKKTISVAPYNIMLNPSLLCLLQEKCTHPEDVKLCTVIVKTNGSMPPKNKKTVCELVFFLHAYANKFTNVIACLKSGLIWNIMIFQNTTYYKLTT